MYAPVHRGEGATGKRLVCMTRPGVAKEIERKFLVRSDAWRAGAAGTLYRQGYLSTQPARTVRVRVAGKRGTLTVKGESHGPSRAEFEYSIPVADANAMLDGLCEG